MKGLIRGFKDRRLNANIPRIDHLCSFRNNYQDI